MNAHYVSEMNIELEMKIRNEMEMKSLTIDQFEGFGNETKPKNEPKMKTELEMNNDLEMNNAVEMNRRNELEMNAGNEPIISQKNRRNEPTFSKED